MSSPFSGGRGIRTPMTFRSADFKSAALPVRASPPDIYLNYRSHTYRSSGNVHKSKIKSPPRDNLEGLAARNNNIAISIAPSF